MPADDNLILSDHLVRDGSPEQQTLHINEVWPMHEHQVRECGQYLISYALYSFVWLPEISIFVHAKDFKAVGGICHSLSRRREDIRHRARRLEVVTDED